MRGYFQLQRKMLNRKIIDFGVPLPVAYILLPVLFSLFSLYLFRKTEFAPYLYGLLGLSLTLRLSEYHRNFFLRSIFSKKRYRMVRIMENLTVAMPFTLFLIYHTSFLLSLLLNLLVVIVALFTFRMANGITIPTPFGKRPFEFTIGFRKSFYLFPIAYFLTYMAGAVENFNLGIFAMLLIGITCLSYYVNVEKVYFVWNYNLSAKKFLWEKVKTGLLYFALLSVPSLIALSLYFPTEITLLLLFFMLCCIYLITIIFAKYTSFPKEIGLLQGILMVVSFLFPPILLLLIPLFYLQAVQRLQKILT
ncbi:MAG: ABC transporter permease [Bacteroidetes bacterium]|nr:MAG: ABC transporter permease [Bacteroidota bacterium]PIE87903.1 MAG: ABC transporter permease [Bacteroidota bacterium]